MAEFSVCSCKNAVSGQAEIRVLFIAVVAVHPNHSAEPLLDYAGNIYEGSNFDLLKFGDQQVHFVYNKISKNISCNVVKEFMCIIEKPTGILKLKMRLFNEQWTCA